MPKERKTSTEIPRLASEDKATREKAAARRASGNSQKEEEAADRGRYEMTEHQLEHDELAEMYGTDLERGLTTKKRDELEAKYGKNMLTPPPQKSEIAKFMEQMTGFFSLLLWAGATLCFIMWGLKPEDQENLYLGVVLAAVVFFTGVFTYLQESKSAKIMEGFKNMLPTYVDCTRDGQTGEVEAWQLVPGDLVMIKKGDKVPADCIAIDTDNCKVDNSSLTGESEELARSAKCTNESFLETKNVIFFGTSITEGFFKGIVVRTGDKTYIGTIANQAATAEVPDTPLKIEIKHFVKIVSGVAISLGIIFCIIAIIIGHYWVNTLVFTIGIIVANVPEGLLATVTVSLTLTAKRMAAKYVLVKNLEAVETLGSTTTICSDKTGTLTQNRMTVAHLWYDNKKYTCETSTQKNADWDGDSETFRALQRIGTLCNRAEFLGDSENMAKPIPERRTNGDASESAILKFVTPIREAPEFRKANPKQCEIPFSSIYKFQLSVHKLEDRSDKRKLIVMKGAPEKILKQCSHYMHKGEEKKRDRKFDEAFEEAYLGLGGLGERVLGFAHLYIDGKKYDDDFEWNTDVNDANFPIDGLVFVGFMALIDPPRPAVPGAVAKCKDAGIKVIMVTGDHPITAEAISKQVGIINLRTQQDIAKERDCAPEDVSYADAEAIVIHGEKLYDLTDNDWDVILSKPQLVFARTTPSQKLEIVHNNQKRGAVVAVTGDGVNDSPALKKADIGVAMGIAGSDVSKDAADMILLDDNFASIVNGIEEGRLIFDNLKKSIAYTLSSNIPEIAPFLVFVCVSIPLPLSTVLILCVDLGTDMVPAISLAYEEAESDIMRRAPRNAAVDHLVQWKLVCFSYLQIGILQALAGFFVYFVAMNDGFTNPFDNTFVPGIPPDALPFLPKYKTEDLFCLRDNDGELSDCKTLADNVTDNAFDLDYANWGLEALGAYAVRYQPYGSEYVACYGTTPTGYDRSVFAYKNNCWMHWSTGMQTDLLGNAQTAYFVSIVIVQWADLLICKTRKLSLFKQGLRNNFMNFGLFSETALACLLCYVEPLNTVFTTRPIRFVHWLAPLPFFLMIIFYDETRKYLIRKHRADNNDKAGWIEKMTYW